MFEPAPNGARMPVMLKGPSGCGKTRFVEYMAWKLQRPLITVACNEYIRAAGLTGRYLLEPSGTRWQDGPLATKRLMAHQDPIWARYPVQASGATAEDGEEIDLDAALQAISALRMGRVPDPRVGISHRRTTRDLAVLVSLDLSETTQEILPGTDDRPVLDLARAATSMNAIRSISASMPGRPSRNSTVERPTPTA